MDEQHFDSVTRRSSRSATPHAGKVCAALVLVICGRAVDDDEGKYLTGGVVLMWRRRSSISPAMSDW
jgi:hypothetical protein